MYTHVYVYVQMSCSLPRLSFQLYLSLYILLRRVSCSPDQKANSIASFASQNKLLHTRVLHKCLRVNVVVNMMMLRIVDVRSLINIVWRIPTSISKHIEAWSRVGLKIMTRVREIDIVTKTKMRRSSLLQRKPL